MRGLFGGAKKKEEAPVISLSDTSESVSFI
jgi:hypothetical protein